MVVLVSEAIKMGKPVFRKLFRLENPKMYVEFRCNMLNDLCITIHKVLSLIWDQSQISSSIRLEMASDNAWEGQSAQMQIANFLRI